MYVKVLSKLMLLCFILFTSLWHFYSAAGGFAAGTQCVHKELFLNVFFTCIIFCLWSSCSIRFYFQSFGGSFVWSLALWGRVLQQVADVRTSR